MATVKYRVDTENHREHLESLFHFCNSHLTMYESATLIYQQKSDKADSNLLIPKEKLQPIQKTPAEYLAKFLSPATPITTKMIGQTCNVCLDPMMPGDLYRNLLTCQHIFHQNCIENWWVSNNFDNLQCPLCRRSQYKYKDSIPE